MSENPINELSKKTLGDYISTAGRRIERDTEREIGRKGKADKAVNSIAQSEIDSWETSQHARTMSPHRPSPEVSLRHVRHELERSNTDLQNKHSEKMSNRHFGIRTALRKLGAASNPPKVMAKEENEEMNENDTESQEIELTPNQAIIAAAIEGDHVAMADAFDAAVRAKIDAAMFGGDDEEDTE